MPDAPALELVGITHRFGAVVAVSGVSLSVAAGERRVLLGTNGAGKTTLINIILGDLVPHAGTVSLFGRDVTRLPTHRRIRLGMRRTYQTSATFAGLSVRDCLFLAVSGVRAGWFDVVRGARAGRAMKAAEEAATCAGLALAIDTRAGALSHGERRQLEIAMAGVADPKLLLLDEPAAGLSPAERERLQGMLLALPRAVTLIMIEHDVDLALAIADKVTLMHNGRLVAEGPPEAIATSKDAHDIYFARAMS